MNSYVHQDRATAAVPVAAARRVIALACRAPSVHNTQPWLWRLGEDHIELYADWTRRLEAADPVGRNLVISCGAALHHLQVAARAHGFRPSVTYLAHHDDPTLLARVRLTPSPRPRTAAAELQAIADRCTDRRRFTSWPVPAERLVKLTEWLEDQDCLALALVDPAVRYRTEMLVSRAQRVQARDARIVAEVERWTDHGHDGVPSDHVPRADGPQASRSRFPDGALADEGREVESGDGLIVVYDEDDSPRAWLRAGESLSALWLRAVQDGLSVVPLSQVVEVAETRDALQHQVLDGDVPLLLVRMGWQAISRSHLRPTPRRPVDEVLLPSTPPATMRTSGPRRSA